MTSAPAEPVVIDGGDRTCIALLLEVRDRMSDLAAGTVIHVIASDPAAPIDLPAWCYLTGHDYLGSVRAATPTYALRIGAAPAATGPASPWRRAITWAAWRRRATARHATSPPSPPARHDRKSGAERIPVAELPARLRRAFGRRVAPAGAQRGPARSCAAASC